MNKGMIPVKKLVVGGEKGHATSKKLLDGCEQRHTCKILWLEVRKGMLPVEKNLWLDVNNCMLPVKYCGWR